MAGYKYIYVCPKCKTYLELKMRVTQTKRKCPQCGTPITPQEIDRQTRERNKRNEAETKRIAEQIKQQQAEQAERVRQQQAEQAERARQQQEQQRARIQQQRKAFDQFSKTALTVLAIAGGVIAVLFFICLGLCVLGNLIQKK
jgi:DNA-directed RNA polymerase subunit M/transcription elongation factor TFIIS